MEDKQIKISVRGLVKTFGDLEVLKGMDVDVADGEVLSLIGPSGSGKTTLMKTLLHLLEPIEGQILYGDGMLATEIGYLPQQSYPLEQRNGNRGSDKNGKLLGPSSHFA